MRRTRRVAGALALGAAVALVAGCSSGGPTAKSAGSTPAASAGAPTGTAVPARWASHGGDVTNDRAGTDTAITRDNVDRLTQAWSTPNLKGVSATPVLADGTLYLGDWTGTVRALDAASGQERWATDLHTYYLGGSPALDGDRLFVGTFDAKVTALDRATGRVLWSTPVDDGPGSAVFASPIVVDGLVVTGVASFQEFTAPTTATFRGHVSALDLATGREVWRFWTTPNDPSSGPGIAVWSAVSADPANHLVFVPTGNNYLPPSGRYADSVVAVDSRTGEVRWATSFTSGDIWTLGGEGTGPDADVGAPPNLFDVKGRPAIGVGDKGGTFHALDRLTGERLWDVKLTDGGAQGGVMASAALHDGTIYVASNKRGTTADLVALATDGTERWRADVGGHATGPVTWSNGLLFLGDDTGRFSAFDDRDGTRRWSVTVPAPAAAGALVADGTLYAGFGWWLASAPADPQGGLIAYRVPAAAGGGATPGSSPTAGGSGGTTQPLGERTYVRSCASCHGGDGSGGFGPSLKGIEGRYDRDQHLAIVREGRNGKMPAWQGVLTPEEIEAVVDYERSTFR